MIVKTYQLDIHSSCIPVVVHLSQYDSDFSLVFELYSSYGTFTIESGTTVEVRGTKSDNKGYSASATLDINNNKVTVAGDQQMTAVAGKNIFELTLWKNNKELNTANFIIDVEPAALDRDTIVSESKIMELLDVTDRADEIIEAAETIESSAAQIAINTQRIAIIEEEIADIGSGLSDEVTAALLNCFEHVAWIDEHGQDYYYALEAALLSIKIVGITAVFTQGSTVIHAGDSLDSLREHLVVTAYYSNYTSAIVSDYTLSGTLAAGTSTITASYGGKTATFTVTVSAPVTLSSITATFTQGSAVIHADDSLDDLKQYLVVTATYSDSTTATVPSTDYTLSGTLTVGTSTITATYSEKTATFNVTVTQSALLYNWDFTQSLTDTVQGVEATLHTGEDWEIPGKSEGTTLPVRSSAGVTFDNAQQLVRLLSTDVITSQYLSNKTVQIDVASFSSQYTPARQYGMRFLMVASQDSNGYNVFDLGCTYNAPQNSGSFGWRAYSRYGYDGRVDSTIFDSDINAINGHTVGIYFASDGKIKMYIDGVSKGTSAVPLDDVAYRGLQIGAGGRPSYGGCFYNAVITGARIYDGDIA